MKDAKINKNVKTALLVCKVAVASHSSLRDMGDPEGVHIEMDSGGV